MKKLGCLLLFMTFLYCCGAAFHDLSNEDAGQLILSHESRSILIYRKSIDEGDNARTWQCTPYKGSGVYHLSPARCSVLDYSEKTFTPESVALELAYWSCLVRSEKNILWTEAYRKAAQKTNSPLTNSLLGFYAELDKHCVSVGQGVRDYKRSLLAAPQTFTSYRSSRNSMRTPAAVNNFPSPGGTEAEVLLNALKRTMENTDFLKCLDDMIDKEKNFFIACCMYLSYRRQKIRLLQMCSFDKSVKEAFYEEIVQLGDDIRTKFAQERSYNRTRESAFKLLCPNKHGKWEFAPPTDMKGMNSFVFGSYRAWHDTLTLSPYSEFPDWGNAALEVLQMFRNSALEQKFDSAYSEYRKYNGN